MGGKIVAQVIVALVSKLASVIFSALKKALSRKKLHDEDEAKAKKVEDAKTPDEVISAADDLP
jgi:hypothetical protein